MTAKAKIKVIKKGEIKTAVKSDKAAVTEKGSTKAAAREMVSTVTTWVSDFQHRKREETRTAIEKFLGQQPQTTGA
jgi:phenylpyruvate tautomerase PptA (4-oxalocrotonate tautomerase family)